MLCEQVYLNILFGRANNLIDDIVPAPINELVRAKNVADSVPLDVVGINNETNKR